MIFPNRTDKYSIPAYSDNVQLIFNYLTTGKAQEISFDSEKFEVSKNQKDFAIMLFKALVEGKVRINTMSAFQGAKYPNAITNHKKRADSL